MKTDAQLKLDVTSELNWDPAINSNHIGVAVSEGVVTLTGHIETYAEKAAVERHSSVSRVSRRMRLNWMSGLHPAIGGDTEFAQAAESGPEMGRAVPDDKIQVKVEKVGSPSPANCRGITSGQPRRRRWIFIGVVGVSNDIRLKDRPVPSNVADRIRQALVRHAEQEAKDIHIDVNGNQVTLRGSVDSWEERVAAQGAAFSAPGVAFVVNELRLG